MGKNDLKRDKRFKRHLAQQLQVEQPPQSYLQAVQDAFDSLPDELPVKARPLRTFARACATLAACAVLVAAGTFGLNRANPGLMESLPGVGQLFQQLNGTVDLPQETENHSLPTPTPIPQDPSQLEEQQAEERAPFQPVSVQNDAEGTDDSFTVEDAWSDGIYLHLCMTARLSDPAWQQEEFLFTQTEPYMEDSETFQVTVDGAAAELVTPLENRVFTLEEASDDGSSLYRAEWVAKLPHKLSHNQEMEVSLSLSCLTGGSSGLVSLPDYQLDFRVTADTSRNFLWNTLAEEPPVEDNGVSLQWVESTPTNLRFSVEVPFFGRMSYTMLTPAEEADFATSAAPLGIYPLLSTPEGDLLQDSSVEWSPNSPEDVYYAGPYTGVGTFVAPAEDVPYVVLTLYEYPPYSAAEEAAIANNRVVAEFTIDLETRQVYASQHYRDQGLEKLSLANSLKEDRTPTPVNGYICAEPSLYGDPLQVALFTPDLDYHPVAVYCYSGDTLVCIAYSHPQNEYNSYEEIGDGRERAYYEDENGTYRADIIASPTIQGGQTYKRMQFTVYNTAGIEFTRLELVDVETGQVLIEDIQRAYYHQMDEVFGTQLEAYQYGEAAVEPSPSPPAVESRLQEDAGS
ncbi:MAG: hypothetical protein ACLTEG_09745 [Acutalibacter sp.]